MTLHDRHDRDTQGVHSDDLDVHFLSQQFIKVDWEKQKIFETPEFLDFEVRVDPERQVIGVHHKPCDTFFLLDPSSQKSLGIAWPVNAEVVTSLLQKHAGMCEHPDLFLKITPEAET